MNKTIFFTIVLGRLQNQRKFIHSGMKSFRLHACREDGNLEAQTVELTWDTVTEWESDEESMAFCFQYSRNEKPSRWVKVYTPYVSCDAIYSEKFLFSKLFFIFYKQHSYLADCFDRIMEERKWNDSGD